MAKILGHSDTRTTLHYLGLDYEDMSSAFSRYAEYQKMVKCPEKGTFSKSQSFSGPNGNRPLKKPDDEFSYFN